MIAENLPTEPVEPLLPLGPLLRSFGLEPSPATTWRWIRRGRNGAKLQVVRAGRLLSRRSWVAAFVAAITENSGQAAPSIASPAKLDARHRRALSALAK